MSARGWGRSAVRTRVYMLLRAAGAAGLPRAQIVSALKDVPDKYIEDVLSALKRAGWVQHGGKGLAYQVTEYGALPPIAGLSRDPAPGAQEGAEQAAQAGEAPLAVRALALVQASTAGLDSGQLAQQLGVTADAVEEAMEIEAVRYRRVITCTVIRGGERLTLYRLSSGGARATDGHTLPTPATTRAAPVAADEAALADDLTEVADAAPATAPATAPKVVLPVVECDIDAVHRHRPLDCDAGDELCAAAGFTDDLRVEDEGFMAALYSNDVLWIQLSGGTQISLDAQDTRRLFRYLDRLASTRLEAALEGQA